MTELVLRAAAGLRSRGGASLIPCWIAPALLFCAAVLIPWTAILFLTLPRHYGASHWRIAWGGFDLALGAALASTAIAALRRSPFGEVAAAVTGALLICDAWFDVLTSHGSMDITQAIVEAVVVELPLAVLCFWIARNLAQAMEAARPYLEAAGFTVRDHKLIAPEQARPPSPAVRAGLER